VDCVIRLLLFLLGTLTANRPGQPEPAGYRAGDSYGGAAPGARYTEPDGRVDGAGRPGQPQPLPPWDPTAGGATLQYPDGRGRDRGPRRRRIPPWVKRTAVLVAVGLIFRRAIAYVTLIALSAALHLVGVNLHLPSIRFGWPWQAFSAASTTTNVDLGPWVLQKIEGISRPALGQANFSFIFTHKVSKNIGPWPCWYASTFYAAGHASATVDLNPGTSWWAPGTGHYRLQVLSRPRPGKPGQVTVIMVLPRPQLPQSVHNVTIDNIPSKPMDSQHSWTYPGFGCGVVLRPQFPESVLYSQAQQIAFYKSQHAPQVTRSLVLAAETEATQTIRDNFIQPTVNALGYTLDRFAIHWAAAP
jgi:hypothetical protein